MSDTKKQLLKELNAEDSDSGEEEDSGSNEDEFEDFDDMVVHDDAPEEDKSKAPVWATINFGSPSKGGGLCLDGKRRATLGDFSSDTLAKERKKMDAESGEGGEQPKLRSWAVKRAAMTTPSNQQSSEEKGASDNAGEQPKLRSWATRRTAAEVFSLPTGGEQKTESSETKKEEEEKTESSASSDQPKMRSWVSRKGGSPGAYTSLSQLAEKYANLKEKSEQAKQEAVSQGLPAPDSSPRSDERKDSPTPEKRRASVPSSSSPLANNMSKKSPSNSPTKSNSGGSPNKNDGSPNRTRSGSMPAVLGKGGKFSNSIHGSLSRSSQKEVQEELQRQRERELQKKREKRAKYRAKQKVRKHENDEKLKEERKKQKEKRNEEEIIEEEEKKLTTLEKRLREMVEELERIREAHKKSGETESETKKESGAQNWEEETKKIVENLGGTMFSNAPPTWSEALFPSLRALQAFWVACDKINKESEPLLKLDLSCFVVITGKSEGNEGNASTVLQRNLRQAISNKFNISEGEEGGIKISAVEVEELEVAKKFWAHFDSFWEGKQVVEKLKEEKKLKGLASTEELEKKVKLVRTLVGMLLWDYSLSLLRDPKFVTTKFSGLEGMGNITFFVGRPHTNVKEEEEHWVGVLWGKGDK